MFRIASRIILAGSLILTGVSSALAVELIMVEQKGCHYCEAWMDEIGPAYPKTAEGKFAPLIRRDINAGAPDGASYSRRVNFTPTFILMKDDRELARIEGYPGEDFFWPLYTQLLEANTDFESAQSE